LTGARHDAGQDPVGIDRGRFPSGRF